MRRIMSHAHATFLKLRMYRRLRWLYKKKAAKKGSFYLKGYRYCARCRKWFKTEDKFCPMCNKILRCSPHDAVHRRRYNLERGAKYVVFSETLL